jgi:hypothetical protein
VRELEAAELIVHAGDFVAVSVLDELEAFGPVAAVHGNMDDAALQAALPATRVVEVDELRIGVVHDGGGRAGRAERLLRRFPACGAIVYGHSHLPEVSRYAGVWILNPGSPTERRRAPTHTLIRLEVAGGEARPQLVEV